MGKTIGVFLMGDDMTGKFDWSLIFAMWWRTLVIRPDKGEEEIFSVRYGYAKSMAAFGLRVVWRK